MAGEGPGQQEGECPPGVLLGDLSTISGRSPGCLVTGRQQASARRRQVARCDLPVHGRGSRVSPRWFQRSHADEVLNGSRGAVLTCVRGDRARSGAVDRDLGANASDQTSLSLVKRLSCGSGRRVAPDPCGRAHDVPATRPPDDAAGRSGALTGSLRGCRVRPRISSRLPWRLRLPWPPEASAGSSARPRTAGVERQPIPIRSIPASIRRRKASPIVMGVGAATKETVSTSHREARYAVRLLSTRRPVTAPAARPRSPPVSDMASCRGPFSRSASRTGSPREAWPVRVRAGHRRPTARARRRCGRRRLLLGHRWTGPT
ncbi:Uncharacterised protein [Actinomyces howellii]|uniref:Uncharacterized protein n=1 Tax=Actinomyces howellii TaxID=52771 RepID=A0A3S4SMV9_9ACTO|nr:Uncharacterised protein [Actinomyces howellii]